MKYKPKKNGNIRKAQAALREQRADQERAERRAAKIAGRSHIEEHLEELAKAENRITGRTFRKRPLSRKQRIFNFFVNLYLVLFVLWMTFCAFIAISLFI